MKRLALLLLAFTMLCVAVNAEESFVEEDFVTAASPDEEFFAEESFLGDGFEAEQVGNEDDLEDRADYLFEDEWRPTPDLADWQKWEIRNFKATSKNKKVTLTWNLYKGEAAPSGQPDARPSSKEKKAIKEEKVCIYIYQVDPITGVATEVKKNISVTTEKKSFAVKRPGSYAYYIRLEKVDKNGNEYLGKASDKAEVKVSFGDKKIRKVKPYSYVYADLSGQPTEPEILVDVYVDVIAKEASDKYIIKAQQKGGTEYTGIYTTNDDEKNTVFVTGEFRIPLKDVNWDGGKAPKFTGNNKSTITVKVQAEGIKTFKKCSVKLSGFSEKTAPRVYNAWQSDATTITVEWIDETVRAKKGNPASYTIKIGSKTYDVKLDKDADGNPIDKNLVVQGIGDYKYTVNNYPANTKSKAKKTTIRVMSNVKGAKMSSAYYLYFSPVSKGSIFNAGYDYVLDEHDNLSAIKVTWDSIGADKKCTFEVYATDNLQTAVLFEYGTEEMQNDPSANTDAKNYSATFTAGKLKDLKGTRLSFTIKAVEGNKVLARELVNAYNPKVEDMSEQPSEQEEKPDTPVTPEEPTEEPILVDADRTLAEAIAIAKDGDTIKLMIDAETASQIRINKKITIDLGGKTLTVSYSEDGTGLVVEESGDLLLKNGTVATDVTQFMTVDAGSLTLGKDLIVKSTSSAGLDIAMALLKGQITIDGAQIQIGDSVAVSGVNEGTKVVMTGGSVDGVLLVNDVKISGGTVGALQLDNTDGTNAKCEISGGTIKIDSIPAGAKVNITGGTITIVEYDPDLTIDNLTITGGTFNFDVSGFCPEGFTVNMVADGIYTVEGSK